MAKKKFNVAGEDHYSIDGKMIEIKKQLRARGGSPIDPALVNDALQNIVENIFCKKKKNRNKVLSLISENEILRIEPANGYETLAEAKAVFPTGIDNDFKNWSTNKGEGATMDTMVQVYEMEQDANFKEMFMSLSKNLDKLCLTQHQIKIFCKNYPHWLRADGLATFFLFKVKKNEEQLEDQYYVADVDVDGGGLYIMLYRYSSGITWDAEAKRRLVVPKY